MGTSASRLACATALLLCTEEPESIGNSLHGRTGAGGFAQTLDLCKVTLILMRIQTKEWPNTLVFYFSLVRKVRGKAEKTCSCSVGNRFTLHCALQSQSHTNVGSLLLSLA